MADNDSIMPLLDQPDPAFGWSSICMMMPQPWRFLAMEVTSHFDRQIEKIYGPQG